MTLGKLQRSYTELPWMYRWGNLDYDYIVWNIKEVVSGNTKASTLILSTSGIWLQLPLNQKTVVMLQGNYSLIQNEKITMCSVIMADQQSCDPTRLASSRRDGQNGQRALACSSRSRIRVLVCWCRSPRIGRIQDRLTSTIPEDLRSKAEC